MSFSQGLISSVDIEPFSYASDPWKPALSENDFLIRLIELYPLATRSANLPERTLEESPLCCRIFWTPLKSTAPFKALSYQWGDKPPTHKILVHDRGLMITESLNTALRHLQHQTESIIIWIDQICVNQKDDAEKTEQVAHMGQIYRAAEEVLVWVGPAEDSSDDLMDVWTTVGKWAEDWGMMSYYTRERYPIFTKIWHNVDPTDPKTIEFHQICNRALPLFDQQFFNAMIVWQEKREWFSRVWVVQEFGLARQATFVCGRKRVTAEQVLLTRQIFNMSLGKMMTENPGAIKLDYREAALIDPMQAFFALRQRRKAFDAGSGTGDGLYRLLQTLYVDNAMKATHLCDTIYGLLGIANDADKLQIRADYSLKSRVDLIYTRTAKAIIADGNLDVIGFSQNAKKLTKLPSWVPDWSSNPTRSFAWQSAGYEERLFKASHGSTIELLSVADEHVLGLRGIRIDEIEAVANIWDGNDFKSEGDQADAGHIYDGYSKYLEQVKLMCLRAANKHNEIYSDPKMRAEAVWRVPVGDIEETELNDTIRATSLFEDAYKRFLIQLDFLGQSKSITESEFREKLQEFGPLHYRSRMQEMRYKRPFLSNLGYVGMGPLDMRVEDLIVVFVGAQLPYIIRPLEGQRWLFVGECYCHGIMDGEGMTKGVKESFFLE